MRGPGRTTLACLLCAAVSSTVAAQEALLRLDVLRNGGFERHAPALVDAQGVEPLPWWRTPRGAGHAGEGVLVLRAGERAEQPLALDPVLASSVRIAGRVDGAARVVVVDGAEGEVAQDVQGAFEFDGAELERRLGRKLVPRLLLRLECADGEARFSGLRADAQFPCPSAPALAAEVGDELALIVREWEERALDDAGPRRTRFVARVFDVESGAELSRLPACAPYIPFWASVAALAREGRDERAAALHAAWFADFLELGFAPGTGLPAMWDPLRDEPLLDRPVEIALPLGHLVDVARGGPEAQRAPALAQAVRIAETVLATGLLPDGTIAASYVPRDGRPNLDTALLRRLDVAAQLARLAPLVDGSGLSSRLDSRRLLRAAHEALGALEYLHHWSGTWQAVDPGFDDEYGHYGARAALVARDVAGETLFRRFALEGLERYLEPWRGAAALGGNLAADQVRCWQVAADLAAAEPSLVPRLRPVLLDALHAHMQGEQYGNGAWGDVTIYRFDPRTALQVGDLPGTPSNLLQGIATLAAPHLGLPQDEIRARYASVLRSTRAQYRRPHGYLVDRAPRAGANTAAGSLRVLLGLERMLVALSPRR